MRVNEYLRVVDGYKTSYLLSIGVYLDVDIARNGVFLMKLVQKCPR
jgi:hypothetical protein